MRDDYGKVSLPVTTEARAIPRITITLTDEMHRALNELAARQGRSIGALIEECLELRSILPPGAAREIVARARSSAGLIANEAMAIAVRETRLHREAPDD